MAMQLTSHVSIHSFTYGEHILSTMLGCDGVVEDSYALKMRIENQGVAARGWKRPLIVCQRCLETRRDASHLEGSHLRRRYLPDVGRLCDGVDDNMVGREVEDIAEQDPRLGWGGDMVWEPAQAKDCAIPTLGAHLKPAACRRGEIRALAKPNGNRRGVGV